MGNRDTDAARSYHAHTKHSERSLRSQRHRLDWDNQPIPFKLYRDLEPLPLPQLRTALKAPALRALGESGRGADGPGGDRVPDLAALSRVLYFAAGIIKTRRFPGGEIQFRAHPNTGALYHLDLYVVCGELPGLGAGVYHFGPHDFALRRLRDGDHRERLVAASGGEPRVAEAPAIVACASTWWRNAWKYRARAYRHCFWDSGTLHANLLAVAGTEGLAPRVVLGFEDAAVAELLGLDPEREAPLALVPLGHASEPAPAAPAAAPLALATHPVSAREVEYPEIRAMHEASMLGRDEVARWRQRHAATTTPAAQGRCFAREPLGDGELPEESIESVIRRRGSTRTFDPAAALSARELATALDRATRGVDADFVDAGGDSLLELYLIVHNVDDLPAGLYYYRRRERALELLRAGHFRGNASRLGLFQQLPADAAVNVYCMCALEPVLAALGNRGYRAAQFEGGLVGGRLYLAAYAQRFGATGLTFLDDEVTDLLSPHAAGKSPMFLAALGRALRRPEAA